MNPSRLFVLRPVATTLLMVAILLSGLIAYRGLGGGGRGGGGWGGGGGGGVDEGGCRGAPQCLAAPAVFREGHPRRCTDHEPGDSL